MKQKTKFEQAKQEREYLIKKHGWMVMKVSDPEGVMPKFSYTIGLWESYHHPEIIVLGLNSDVAHTILNDIGSKIKNGEVILENKNYKDIVDTYPVQFLKVRPGQFPEYLGLAMDHYRDQSFEALQLVHTDKQFNFPWDEAYNTAFKKLQPLLNIELTVATNNADTFTSQDQTDLQANDEFVPTLITQSDNAFLQYLIHLGARISVNGQMNYVVLNGFAFILVVGDENLTMLRSFNNIDEKDGDLPFFYQPYAQLRIKQVHLCL